MYYTTAEVMNETNEKSIQKGFLSTKLLGSPQNETLAANTLNTTVLIHLLDLPENKLLQCKLTLLALDVVGDGVSACGQRGGEQHVSGGRLVLRVKAGLSAPAAQ